MIAQVLQCLAVDTERPGDLFPPRCILMRGHRSPHRSINPWAKGAAQWPNNEVDRA